MTENATKLRSEGRDGAEKSKEGLLTSTLEYLCLHHTDTEEMSPLSILPFSEKI